MDSNSIPFLHRGHFARLLTLSILVSLGLVALLGVKADWETVFARLDFGWLGTAWAAMVLLQFISGYRLYNFLPGARQQDDGRVLNSVKVMFLFQALLKMLPFRLGEAGFFWLAKRYLDMGFRDTLGVFLAFRIWDFRVVALSFLLCGGLVLRDTLNWGRPLFLIVAVFGIAMFLISSARLIRMAETVFGFVHRLCGFAWSERLADSLADSASTLAEERSMRNSLLKGILSVITWCGYYTVFHCLYVSVGVELSWSQTVMVVSGMTLIGVLPIQTLGGIGLMELGQASLLALTGLNATEAASKSLAAGGLFLGLCLGVPALLFLTFGVLERMASGRRAETP